MNLHLLNANTGFLTPTFMKPVEDDAAATAIVAPGQQDLIVLAGTPEILHAADLVAVAGEKPLNKREMAARYTNNIALHLLFSDAPAAMSMVANAGALPPTLAPVLDCFNVFNTVTGVVAIAADVRETRGTFKNPHATKTDRLVDVTHLVAGDVLSTAASLTPLVCSLNHPVALGFFMGGQIIGIGMDVYKTCYDFKRKGQQSAA